MNYSQVNKFSIYFVHTSRTVSSNEIDHLSQHIHFFLFCRVHTEKVKNILKMRRICSNKAR